MTYGRTGKQFLVNKTTSGDQKLNSIQSLADGKFVALFSDASGLAGTVEKGRIFSGEIGSAELPSAGNQDSVELSNGQFVSVQANPGGTAISVQLLTSQLAASGKPIVVTTDTGGGSFLLLSLGAIAQPSGGFVAGWAQLELRTGHLAGFFQQTFDTSGKSLGAAVAFDGLLPGGVAALSDSRIAIFNQSNHSVQIYAADLSGAATVVLLETSTNKTANPAEVRIEALQNGTFAVIWAEDSQASGLGPLHAQVFGANGRPLSEDIIVDRAGPAQARSFDVASLASGDFAIAWARRGSDTGSEIAVKTFSATGEEIGFQQDVNTTKAGNQSGPAISALTTGGFVVGWNDPSGAGIDKSGFAVQAQVFASNVGLVLTGSAGADTLTGTARDDILSGLGGDDMLAGLDGRDTASYGGAGAGVQVSLALTTAQNTGGAGTDTLSGIENLIGSGFNDRLSGDASANVLTGGAGADSLRGEAGADRLVGGAGADTLSGGSGADVMIGGTGNDTYYVDNIRDQVFESHAVSATGKLLGGTDTIISSVSYTLPEFVEVLRLAVGGSYIDGTGNAGNNTIIGNAGTNVLDGAGGNDRLTGGNGIDLFKLNAFGTGTTVITDFHSGLDILGIKDPFGSELVLGTAATTLDQRVIYDKSTGNLYYDPDGVGGQDQALIAVLLGKPDLYEYDFYFV